MWCPGRHLASHYKCRILDLWSLSSGGFFFGSYGIGTGDALFLVNCMLILDPAWLLLQERVPFLGLCQYRPMMEPYMEAALPSADWQHPLR